MHVSVGKLFLPSTPHVKVGISGVRPRGQVSKVSRTVGCGGLEPVGEWPGGETWQGLAGAGQDEGGSMKCGLGGHMSPT